MLVAIGAVALVSVGLAAIFQTVGKTVTTGKRISHLSQQAAVLESQMREDFSKLTRDGFMVIRHQFTIDGVAGNTSFPAVVSTTRFKGDPSMPRPRRIDEIIFFASGDYRSAREQIIPGRAAEARSARIYYGHGQRGAPMGANATDPNYDFYNPGFDNRSFFGTRGTDPVRVYQHRLGGKVPDGYAVPGVNYYASDWTLLRHATLLQKPGSAPGGGWPENLPRPTISGNDSWATGKAGLDRLSSDNPYQIAGQPAAPSVFRVLNECLQMNMNADESNRQYAMFWPTTKQILQSPPIVPRFESGLVEIATTDLDEIALMVNGSGFDPTQAQDTSMFTGRPNAFIPPMLKVAGSLYTYPWDTKPLQAGAPNLSTNLRRYFEPQPIGSVARETPMAVMQSWMLNALPSPSGYHPTYKGGFYDTANPGAQAGMDPATRRIGARIRYDDKTPDLRGTLDAYSGRDAMIRRADLLSLGLARVAAHCTEFVVEWSWGQTYPTGTLDEWKRNVSDQVVWYGRTLQTFSNGVPDIVRSDSGPCPDVYHYQPNYQNPYLTQRQFAPPLSPAFRPFAGDTTQTSSVQGYQVSDALVHGVMKRPSYANEKSSLVSFFGYYDPTFIPATGGNDPPSMPWPWPKMLRITITLADANDPSIEQSFQYVFDLPPDPKP